MSVLGPLLFGFFIRNLPTVLNHCECTQYADAKQIYLHAHPSDLDNVIKLIEEDAEAVVAWAQPNSLELNARKTKAMILGIIKYIACINPQTKCKIRIDGTPVE